VPYTYEKDGFEATHYDLSTDQLGTQLDPPAHWNPSYPAIDELPATYAIRPLVVISIYQQAAKDPGYQMTVDDIKNWENAMGAFRKDPWYLFVQIGRSSGLTRNWRNVNNSPG
jgi:kynurenine formamidase